MPLRPLGLPLIGITSLRFDLGGRIMHATHDTYATGVRAAGGIPHLLPVGPASEAEETAARLDGLLLSGGGDVRPALYGHRQDPETDGIDADRDEMETALVRYAARTGMPVLGICRGFQVMNVALGGTLIQHLPCQGRAHLQTLDRAEVGHAVHIATGSVLSRVVSTGTIGANSFHHQGLDTLAPDLEAVGWAEDGLVEAVVHRSRPMLGVQWHPEDMPASPEHRALFGWLVAEAGKGPRSPALARARR